MEENAPEDRNDIEPQPEHGADGRQFREDFASVHFRQLDLAVVLFVDDSCTVCEGTLLARWSLEKMLHDQYTVVENTSKHTNIDAKKIFFVFIVRPQQEFFPIFQLIPSIIIRSALLWKGKKVR